MGYVGILLITILVSFIIVRIGGLALQLTGIEADVARFQALSAFSGTGFTTTEAERVVRNRTRRRIVTVLIILGNAGLVTIMATLVASFTQVTGYAWFFIRLAVIICSIFVLYKIVISSSIGNNLMTMFRKPLVNRILREAPTVDEVFHFGSGWGVSLVMVQPESGSIGNTVSAIQKKYDVEILAIDRNDNYLPRPSDDEKIRAGDRFLVYGKSREMAKILA